MQIEDEAARKHLGKAELRQPFEALIKSFESLPAFDQATLDTTLRKVAEESGVKAGALIHATRVAVTGRGVSPGIFEVLELLGRQRAIERMTEAVRAIPA